MSIQYLRQKERKKRGGAYEILFSEMSCCFELPVIYQILFLIKVPSYPNWKYRLPTTSELAEQEQTLLRKPIKEGLNSVPTTQKEKTDCAILLSPSQLFKVVVGKSNLFVFYFNKTIFLSFRTTGIKLR
jgi:hypothetical protein